MKPLALAFTDLVYGWTHEDVPFLHLLRQRYDVTVVDDLARADLLFYSDFGDTHRGFTGRKVYFTIENMLPDYDQCDFAITSCVRPDDRRHWRMPFYAHAGRPEELVKPANFDAEAHLRAKSEFCCFVVSNARSPERNRFFKLLNRRKRVNSGGRHFNNLGTRVADVRQFMATHKFAITFENTSSPGYTTEKITDAMRAGTVPIYWGNPDVGREFNTKSFIHAADFPSLEAVAEHVLRLDADDSLLLRKMREPWCVNNEPPEAFRLEGLRDRLVEFIEGGEGPGPRIYRKRRLREHVYGSPLRQSWISLKCRVESLLWKAGFHPGAK